MKKLIFLRNKNYSIFKNLVRYFFINLVEFYIVFLRYYFYNKDIGIIDIFYY